jgi:hypothetical protein
MLQIHPTFFPLSYFVIGCTPPGAYHKGTNTGAKPDSSFDGETFAQSLKDFYTSYFTEPTYKP